MIVLDASPKKIQVVLAGAVTTNQLDCYATWREFDTTTYVAGDFGAATNNTTDVDLVAAPGASKYRVIDYISVYNKDTAAATVTVKTDNAGTERILAKVLLPVGYKLEYVEGTGFKVLDTNGAVLGVGTPGVDGVDGAPGSAGVGTWGTAVIDFGGFPGAADASVAVTGQAGILTTSLVEAWLDCRGDSADHTADEHMLAELDIHVTNIVAGTGFTIHAIHKTTEFGPSRWADSDRRIGAGGGTNQVRPSISDGGDMIDGQWNVFWRWSN